jgi:hypothetical protein
MGRFCRYFSDEYPVPKSSIAELMPRARSCAGRSLGAFAIFHYDSFSDFNLKRRRRQSIFFQSAGNCFHPILPPSR